MKLHHTKHHQTYINSLNAALEKHPELHNKTLEELLIELNTLPVDVRVAVQNHGGGHKNHSLFWELLGPEEGDAEATGSLRTAIDNDLQSFENFQTQFNTAAKTRFGSGWAWLCLDAQNKLVVTSSANQDSPISQGLRPFIGLDVWEHAYYLKYQNKRVDYIDAWWHVINWRAAEKMYKKALQG